MEAVDSSNMDFARSVARGLGSTPKQLECRFLYDSQGSELFELICEQPEYYPTRTEREILEGVAASIAEITGPLRLVEFGSGNSTKTQILLEAYADLYGGVHYMPVDISDSILKHAKRQIETKLPRVTVDAYHSTYDEAFKHLIEYSPVMLLFLGSSMGNFHDDESREFWIKSAGSLSSGDFCLLGLDITENPDEIRAAYNDEAGHSAAFSKNIFERMNRELGSSLDTEHISHIARYSEERRRVEIFARFEKPQTIHVAPLEAQFDVDEGELILVEISRKFDLDKKVPYLRGFGLESVEVYSDQKNRFAVLLLRRV